MQECTLGKCVLKLNAILSDVSTFKTIHVGLKVIDQQGKGNFKKKKKRDNVYISKVYNNNHTYQLSLKLMINSYQLSYLIHIPLLWAACWYSYAETSIQTYE